MDDANWERAKHFLKMEPLVWAFGPIARISLSHLHSMLKWLGLCLSSTYLTSFLPMSVWEAAGDGSGTVPLPVTWETQGDLGSWHQPGPASTDASVWGSKPVLFWDRRIFFLSAFQIKLK